MVLIRKWKFFQLFFLRQYRPGKCLLRYFWNEKTAFQAINKRISKGRKTDIFPKRLTHGFALKMAIYPTFFFLAIQARETFFTIFQNKKTPFQPIKTRSLKFRKIDIFPKGLLHGLRPKMAFFFQLFVLGNIGQGNVFYNIPERKNAFLGYK